MVTTILFGLYYAGVGIALTLIGYFTGIDRSAAGGWFGYLSLPFLALFLWLAMKERKEDDYGGTMSYGQGVGTGVLVGVWSGIVMAIFIFAYFTRINPGMIDFTLAKQEAAMQARQMDPTQISNAMAMAKKWFVPIAIVGSVLGSVFLATLFSLLIAIFTRTNPAQEEIKAV